MHDGGKIGKLQVRLLVPFSLFFFHIEKLFFLCFSWTGKEMMLGGVMQAWK